MSYYSVFAVTPTNDDWISSYVEPVYALLTKHGGKYLARTTSHEQIEGERQDAALRVIIEWPSKEAALAFMHDPEYRPYLEARTAGSESYHFLIDAKDDLV